MPSLTENYLYIVGIILYVYSVGSVTMLLCRCGDKVDILFVAGVLQKVVMATAFAGFKIGLDQFMEVMRIGGY